MGCGYFVAPPLGAASPRADCTVPTVKLRAVVPLEQRRGGPPQRMPSGPHPLSSASPRPDRGECLNYDPSTSSGQAYVIRVIGSMIGAAWKSCLNQNNHTNHSSDNGLRVHPSASSGRLRHLGVGLEAPTYARKHRPQRQNW